MKIQTYEPYRATLLTKDELKRLYILEPNHVIKDTFLAWVTIFIAWTTVALHPHWLVILIAILVIGTQIYSLLIIAHDGLHRRLFTTKRANDFWNDVLILGSICTITRINRLNHMRHHRELALPTDPDRFKYSQAGRTTPLMFIFSLTCIPLLFTAFRNVIFPKHSSKDLSSSDGEHIQEHGYKIRDIAIIFIWQFSLIGCLSVLIAWWAYPILWVTPLVFAVCCDILRVFCEHSQLTSDSDADSSMRLVSYEPNRIEKILFSPNNMNHHIAHHLWPSIPYYNLPSTEIIIKSRLTGDRNLIWRSSYFGHILNYWRWLKESN